MLISLMEYAAKHSKDPDNTRKLAAAGRFATAQKIGRNWVIDDSEPWPPRKVKSGAYVGWREKHGKRHGG